MQHIRIWQVLIPRELDPRRQLLQPYLASILILPVEGSHCCGEMLFWEWVWRITTVFIQANYLLHQKLHPLLSGSCVDIPSFHLRPFARPHVHVEWWISGWVKKNMLPVLIPGSPTLPMITLNKLLESSKPQFSLLKNGYKTNISLLNS